MSPEEILFFKIEDYLRGRLSPTERAAFEAEMASDTELSALVYRQKQENQALELLAERDLRTRMNGWERQSPPVLVSAGGRFRFGWVKWAAAALVVLAAGWWLLDRNTPTDVEAPIAVQPNVPDTTLTKTPGAKPVSPVPQKQRPNVKPPRDEVAQAPERPVNPSKSQAPAPTKKTVDYAALADEFYRERDFFPGGQQTTSPGAAGYDDALQDFKKGKYSDLLSKLRKGGKLNANDLNVKELLGHSLLKSRQYDAAINTFREIVNARRQPYADRAEWAMALVYLQQMPGKSTQLNYSIDRILARPGHLFYARAKALQTKLKK